MMQFNQFIKLYLNTLEECSATRDLIIREKGIRVTAMVAEERIRVTAMELLDAALFNPSSFSYVNEKTSKFPGIENPVYQGDVNVHPSIIGLHLKFLL